MGHEHYEGIQESVIRRKQRQKKARDIVVVLIIPAFFVVWFVFGDPLSNWRAESANDSTSEPNCIAVYDYNDRLEEEK